MDTSGTTGAARHVIHRPGALGTALRSLRQSTGLTVEKLAERAGLSKGYVSLVESGKRSPHWSAVMRLVHAMEDNLCRFLSEAQQVPPPEDHVRTRREDLIVVHGHPPDKWGHVPEERSLGYIWILTSWFEDLHSEIVEICVPPHSGWTPDSISYDADVTALGLQGQLLLELGETSRDEFVMGNGESLQFNARRQHRLRNFTDEIARGVLIVTPPRF